MSLAQKVAQYRFHSREASRLAAEIEQDLQLLAPVRRNRHAPEVGLITALVVAEYAVPIVRLMSRERTDTVAEARMVAMVLLRNHSRLTLQAIGDAFLRDHGTVLHAERAIEARLTTDAQFAQRFARLEASARATLGKHAA